MKPLAAVAAVGGVLGLSGWLGTRHRPDPLTDRPTFRWYRGLDKPPFTPPDPVFGAVWPAIQAGLAWGGYRLLRKPPSGIRNAAVALWTGNVLAIGGWSELFFGGRKLGPAALGAGAMLAGGAAYTAVADRVDRKAALTGVPFIAWLAFASVLAEEVWRRNR